MRETRNEGSASIERESITDSRFKTKAKVRRKRAPLPPFRAGRFELSLFFWVVLSELDCTVASGKKDFRSEVDWRYMKKHPVSLTRSRSSTPNIGNELLRTNSIAKYNARVWG